MKFTFLLLLTLMMVNISAISQDKIVKKDGKTIKGDVQREDNEKIYFSMYSSGKQIDTFISKADVDTVIYDVVDPNAAVLDQFAFGVGMGLDYGGIGANVCIYPQRNIGLFAGVGYALAGTGYNVGTKIRFVKKDSEKTTHAYTMLMYGYNSVIKVSGASEYDKFYYGASWGFGLDFRSKHKAGGYYSCALIIPFRTSEVNDYMDYLETYRGVEFKNGLSPIAISIGYKF